MWDLKACVVCFKVEGKLFKINSGQLRNEFFLVSGIKITESDGLPQYLCVECAAYVIKFKKFRDKCKRAHFALKEILKQNREIKIADLEEFNRQLIDITPVLSYIQPKRAHYEEVTFKWVKHNRLGVTENKNLPVIHHSTLSVQDDFQVPKKKAKLTNLDDDCVKVEADDSFLDVDFSLSVNNDSFLQSTSNNISADTDVVFDNDFQSDNDYECDGDDDNPCKDENKDEKAADGTNLDEEYASMIPITMKESKAAMEVYKMFSQGNICCEVCGKAFFNEKRLQIHSRMHDTHVSGTYFCNLCQYYYKTDFLLKTHMTEKHMYKYLCRKCPEVSFDRTSAKQHFIWTHLQKGTKKNATWYDARPTWLSGRGGKRTKGVVSLRPVRKLRKLPADFLIYSPISQEEQYELVKERKNSRNYMDAAFKCELCFRGFREVETYGNHMKKHDPEISGKLQCDMCKLHFRDARKVYKHMNITHLFKYSCQICNYVCVNRGQAQMHYRWHKNVTYPCPHCKMEFKKMSTRLTHVRIKHPSTFICNLCGHSFVSATGLYCHKKLAHTKDEIEAADAAPIDSEDPHYCADCAVLFVSAAAFKTHLGSSNKHVSINQSVKPIRLTRAGTGAGAGAGTGERRRRGRPRFGSSDIVNNGMPTSTDCEVCGQSLSNDVQARKHYEAEHPGADFLKRYMCDVCGHTTRQYANLMVHMRTHTNEKPYGCPHCDRRFSMPSNRDRHLVVHTGEKRYQCQHCNRRFTQSSAVKLHIQTVHFKIPYAPWDKKNRKRRKELEGASGSVGTIIETVASCLPAQPKLLLDTQGDYLNAYITYNDE